MLTIQVQQEAGVLPEDAMKKKRILVMAGIAALGFVWWKHGDEIRGKVQGTARKMRREIGTLGEQVTDGLDDLARTIEDLSKAVRAVTRTVDTALERVA